MGKYIVPPEGPRGLSFPSPVSALFSKCRTTKVRMADMQSLLSFLYMVFFFMFGCAQQLNPYALLLSYTPKVLLRSSEKLRNESANGLFRFAQLAIFSLKLI